MDWERGVACWACSGAWVAASPRCPLGFQGRWCPACSARAGTPGIPARALQPRTRRPRWGWPPPGCGPAAAAGPPPLLALPAPAAAAAAGADAMLPAAAQQRQRGCAGGSQQRPPPGGSCRRRAGASAGLVCLDLLCAKRSQAPASGKLGSHLLLLHAWAALMTAVGPAPSTESFGSPELALNICMWCSARRRRWRACTCPSAMRAMLSGLRCWGLEQPLHRSGCRTGREAARNARMQRG